MKENTEERIDDLQYEGLKLIQLKGSFSFGLDSVLLSDFADVRPADSVLDIGTGTGILPILIYAKKLPSRIVGLEIQPDLASMAARSVELNGLSDRISIVTGDIRDAKTLFPAASFDAVVTNPPYIAATRGLISAGQAQATARHEILCTLEDVIANAAFLLKEKGRFSMVHRPDRLVDIFCLMRQYGLEPKVLRHVVTSIGKKPNLVLILGIRNGRPELKTREPLFVHDADGRYSAEINRIYNRIK
jgi:tRNA1(Val) A37 N6-methylase TrmN6